MYKVEMHILKIRSLSQNTFWWKQIRKKKINALYLSFLSVLYFVYHEKWLKENYDFNDKILIKSIFNLQYMYTGMRDTGCIIAIQVFSLFLLIGYKWPKKLKFVKFEKDEFVRSFSRKFNDDVLKWKWIHILFSNILYSNFSQVSYICIFGRRWKKKKNNYF